MKLIGRYLLFFYGIITIGCTVFRRTPNNYLKIQSAVIQMKLDTIKGFDDLINDDFRYKVKYQRMIDSLGLSSTDTVGFFVRPCFTHRGILFKINSSKCEEFAFNFSNSINDGKVRKIGDKCEVANDFFSFIYEDKSQKNQFSTDSIIVTPPCPVILFIKLNRAFYYRKIEDQEIEHFYINPAFKKLLSDLNNARSMP